MTSATRYAETLMARPHAIQMRRVNGRTELKCACGWSFNSKTYGEAKIAGEVHLDVMTVWTTRQLLNITRAALEHAEVENAKLLAAIKRIDSINDNPADFNSDINKVCDEILRPHLAE